MTGSWKREGKGQETWSNAGITDLLLTVLDSSSTKIPFITLCFTCLSHNLEHRDGNRNKSAP